jgi:MFS family permease
VIAVAAFAAFGGFLFLNTLYLQEVRGLSPVEAGAGTLPMALVTVVTAPLAGRLVGRSGARLPLTIAGVCLVVACALLAGMEPDTPYLLLFVAYAVFGLGFGFVNAPVTNTAVSGMPRAQAGVAAAIASTSRQVGATLGVAIVGAIATSQVGESVGTDLSSASHPAWWVLAGCGAVVLVLGLVATSARAMESARRTAVELNPEALVG